jgi:homoserine O-acetyltransferase
MAVSYPGFMHGIFPISGGGLYSTTFFYLAPLTLSTLESCAGWEGGNYQHNPKVCAYNAMAVAIPFMYTQAWWDNTSTPRDLHKWRNTTGEYYYDIQDAICISAKWRTCAVGSATRQASTAT